MVNTTFTKTLSLMAYENNLTPDVADDYTLWWASCSPR